jgi:hypothetical protein
MIPKRIKKYDKCAVCNWNLNINIHHIIPKSCGGRDTLDNLIPLCSNHHKLAHTQGSLNSEKLAVLEAIKAWKANQGVADEEYIIDKGAYSDILNLLSKDVPLKTGDIFKLVNPIYTYKTLQRKLRELELGGVVLVQRLSGGKNGKTNLFTLRGDSN